MADNNLEIQEAFAEYDRQVIFKNVMLGCCIGVALMPAGTILDYFVYPSQLYHFLKLRLACSFLIVLFWIAVTTRWGRKHPRKLGVVLAFFPAFFISWMIRVEEGAASPYYAGLNFVLLVVGFILHWTILESFTIVTVIVIMYISACLLHGDVHTNIFFNNLYFLVLTGVVVVIGTYFHSKTRFREFAYRYQLNKSKQDLETTNTKLGEQNDALEKANREIREAEAQLIQSERMATLGRLSVSLLHDIRNPLTFAKQAIFNLQDKDKAQAELSPAVQKQLAAIERGIERVEGIITPLYSFSHSASHAAEMLDLADVLTTAHVFVSYELKDKNIVFEQHIAPGQTVFANRNQFISVLINLVENAIHALDLKTFPADTPPSIRITGWMDDRRSFIAIRDNGPGIAPEQRDRLFKAFATTKKPGEGLGLGLNICYNNIQKAGGDLSVNTELGQFCEFVISLPTDGAAAAAAASSTPAS